MEKQNFCRYYRSFVSISRALKPPTPTQIHHACGAESRFFVSDRDPERFCVLLSVCGYRLAQAPVDLLLQSKEVEADISRVSAGNEAPNTCADSLSLYKHQLLVMLREK